MRNKTSTQRLLTIVLIVLAFTIAAVLGGTGALEALLGDSPGENSADVAMQPTATIGTQQDAGDDMPVGQLGDLDDLYAQLIPSVVQIQVAVDPESSMLPQDHPQVPRGEGSGWVYDDNGHIITNAHVVENAESIVVIFSNGMWADAELVAADSQADIAVLEVTPPEGVEWRPLPLEAPDALRPGDFVVALGNPFGLESTLTLGVVSAKARSVPVQQGMQANYTLPDVIQTDAAINPGNSGGPLLNLSGEVVGVNFAIRSATGANAGVGFAIPVSIVQRIVPTLIEEGDYPYPYLGISGSSVLPQVAQENDIPQNTRGAFVASVPEGGPAAQAGLQAGDIIVAAGENEILLFGDLVSYLIHSTVPGDTITLTILRDGEEQEVEVTVGERPEADQQPVASDGDVIPPAVAATLATEAALEEDMLTPPVTDVSIRMAEQDDQQVWEVRLSDGSNVVIVTLDAQSGEILDLSEEQ